jgi:hypothetical protein
MIAAMARGHRGRSHLKGWGDPATMSGLKAACRGAAYLNQALEQTRDNVLRYGESVGCELLNFFVLDTGTRLG